MPPDVLPSQAEQLRAWAAEQRVGGLQVVSATVSEDENAFGETAIFLDLILPTPDPEVGTWPVTEVLALHNKVDERARELNLPLPWHVRLFPEYEVEPDPEDADD